MTKHIIYTVYLYIYLNFEYGEPEIWTTLIFMIYFEEMFYRGQFRGHYSSYFSVEAETKGDTTKESQQEEMAKCLLT